MEIDKAEQFIKDKLISKATSERKKKFLQIVDYSEMAQILIDYHKSKVNVDLASIISLYAKMPIL